MAAMTVELRAAPAHDRVRLTLGPLSPLLDTAPGAELVVAIGRAGDEVEPLLTGTVTNAWHRPWGTVLEGLASTIACSRTAVGRSYVRQGVDEIVRDLASAAEVDVDQADGGVELAVFHADDRRPVWRHLLALAQLTGAEVVAAPSGGLRFRKVRTGSADHTLRAGAELLDWAVGARQPAPAPAATAALVAAGDSDGWHLLGHEPDGGGRSLLNPAVRDRSARPGLGRRAHRRQPRGARPGAGPRPWATSACGRATWWSWSTRPAPTPPTASCPPPTSSTGPASAPPSPWRRRHDRHRHRPPGGRARRARRRAAAQPRRGHRGRHQRGRLGQAQRRGQRPAARAATSSCSGSRSLAGRIGLSSVPRVGDLVVVAFVGGDLNGPVVLGLLYDDQQHPPKAEPDEVVYEVPDDGRAPAGSRSSSPNGNTVTVTDDAVTIAMGGTTITVESDGAVTVEAASDLVLEARAT